MSSSSSSLSTKTVFLLDHSHWMRDVSGVQVEIDWGGNGGSSGRGGGNSSSRSSYYPSFIPPVTKSLWTCVTETVLEYARVVTDLFANERLLRIGLCEGAKGTNWLNNWDVFAAGDGVQQQQSVTFFAEKLGNAGPPPHIPLPHVKSTVSTVGSMQIGIKEGIEALAQPIPAQAAFMQGHGKSTLKAINKGRIVCITTLTPQSVGKGSVDLQEFFASALDQHNRMVAPSSDHLLPILECEFVLISVHPMGKNKFSIITPTETVELSPVLRYISHVVDAEQIVQTMIELCIFHHDLVSTVVTGIPMKEEQNAQHSSNYDVKLWHPRMVTAVQDHQVLKWSSPLTPKTTGLVIHHCTSAVRITPVDVNGRPTTCLTSFLMNGRSVWLETLKKGAGKTTSNLLTSHGGEMWLHMIETARNVLEDPPSISEGVGGRVTDYRIPDFADLIRMNILSPYPKNYYEHVAKKPEVRDSGNPFVRRRSSAEDLKKPVEMAKDRLLRKTSFWPMTIGRSVLFQMAVHIDSLLRLMPQDKMSDMEKIECDKCIWSLMSVESRGEGPVPSGYHKKGQKRDEQWRSVYNELENFIRANQHSENHKKVLECFLESRRADSKIDSRSDNEKGNKQKVQDMEKALAALASFGTTNTTATGNSTGATLPPTPISDSPASPTSAADTGKDFSSSSGSTSNSTTTPATKTLLSLWTAKTEKKNLRVITNTKLYSHLTSGKDASNTASEDNGKPTNNGNLKKLDAPTKA